jgi:hypothetical protein
MATTPTLNRSPSAGNPAGPPGPRRHPVLWLVVLAVVAALAVTFVVGYLVGSDDGAATPEAPAGQPADDPAVDQQPDRDPPAEAPSADEPTVDEPPAPTPPEVRYAEEPRANWDVTGVAADDTLNVRGSPGVDGAVIATLPPDTAELESTGRIARVGDQLWREIIVPGDGAGWVNAAYLTETR